MLKNKGFTRPKFFGKNLGGFTLIELVFIIVIIAILSAIIVPYLYDITPAGKKAAAKTDIKNLATATTAFYVHNDRYPTNKDKNNKAYYYLLFTREDDNNGLIMKNENNEDKSETGFLNTGDFPLIRRDNALFHFIINAREYPAKSWNGSYLDSLALDPWGNSYLIYIRPLWDKTAVMVGPNGATIFQKSWIISAGPNRILEMDLTKDYVARGDDIAVILK